MSELPKGWSLTQLGNLVKIIMGQAPPGRDCNKEGIGTPFVKAGEFGSERPVIREWTTNPLKLSQRGDVLLCVVGATCGKLNLGEDCAIGRSVAALRPQSSVIQSFLYLYLLTKVQYLRAGSVGSAQGVISKEDIATIKFPLPPLKEQRRIVAKLDSLFSRSRRASEELERIPKLIERYKQAVLAAAFRGDLTADWREENNSEPLFEDRTLIESRLNDLPSLPNEWVWRNVGQVAEVTGGLTKNQSRTKFEKKVPYLRVANVYANELRLDEIWEIGITENEWERVRLKPGDLLIVEGNGSIEQIGRVALWNGEVEPCVHQNHLIKMRVGNFLLPKFGLYWLLSPGGRRVIEQVASSSAGLHTLSISKVSALPIPFCSLREMKVLVERIEIALGIIARIEAESVRAEKLRNRLDQATLSKAFRGELVPQNPEDEPASVLLERILTEKRDQPTAKRSRSKKVG